MALTLFLILTHHLMNIPCTTILEACCGENIIDEMLMKKTDTASNRLRQLQRLGHQNHLHGLNADGKKDEH